MERRADRAAARRLIPGEHRFHNGHDFAVAAGAHDAVYLRELGADVVGIALGKTAGNDNFEIRVFLAVGGGFENLFDGFGFGRFDKGAGIDDHGVRLGEIVGKSIPGVLQQSQHFLAVYEVFRAAERDHGHRGGMIHGVSFPDR